MRIRDLVEVADDPNAVETLMECPLCAGAGLVTAEKRAEWLAKYPELAAHLAQPDPPEAA